MICEKCNKNAPSDSEYCSFCGNIVKKETVPTSSVSLVDRGYGYLELKHYKKADEIFETAIVSNDNKALAYMGKVLAKLKLANIESLCLLPKNLNKYDDFKMALKYADEEYKTQLIQCLEACNYNINLKKQKDKKRTIMMSSVCASVAVLTVLLYFVFIPLGRNFYYKDLLTDGKAEKAAKSYTSSKWFEYDKKVKDLFYKSGLSFAEAKDYKNAEPCFEIAKGYTDSENYLNYCKAQNLLARNDLESYNYFTKCKDFLDSKNILETNEYFIIVNKLQGKWYCPGETEEEAKNRLRASGEWYEVDGFFYAKDRYDSYEDLLTTIKNAKRKYLVSGCLLDSSGRDAETIEIDGIDKLEIIQEGVLGYKKYEQPINVVFVDDTHIKLNGWEYKKQ